MTKQRDLSILIPARNEMFLRHTIEDILKNIEADTEVIAVLDGAWSEPEVDIHDRVTIIYVNEAVGQREATNIACRLSTAKYVMKLDAHCTFDKGFDRKMLDLYKIVGDNVTMLPIMRNLWAFDWNCRDCNWKEYQGARPKKCKKCGGNNLRRKMMMVGKHNPQSTSFCFNHEPRFMYFEDYKHRPKYEKDKAELRYTETMSIQGSCFMLTREKYHELNICDASLGSWGNQGIEVACKTWLSGGRVLVNHNTWYAHLFRTRHDFKFPWPVSGRAQKKTKGQVRKLIWSGKCNNQIYPVSWLVEKFWPIVIIDKKTGKNVGWTQSHLDKLKEIEV